MVLSRRALAITGVFLALALLVSFLAVQSVADSALGGEEDLEELEQLLAIEDELTSETETPGRSSEAEILRKFQEIVLEISNDNAKRIVDRNEYVLVLGYTPWCPKSAELMPRFAEAAMALRESGSRLVMAKLDAERHGKAASLLGVKGFPSLIFFVNGSSQPYTGGLTGEEIVIWARKKTGMPVIRLLSTSSAEEFLGGHQSFAVGFFENFEGTEYEEFLKAAVEENSVQFVEVNDSNVAKVLSPGIKEGNHFLCFVKSEPEVFVQFEDIFMKEKILRFIEFNKFPLVTTLTELNSASVFSSLINLQLFIFAGTDDFKTLLLPLQDAARKYKTKIMFVHADSDDDNLSKPFLTLFGLEAVKPVVAAFDSLTGSKYLLEREFSPSNLNEFCSGLLNGNITPYFKSEPIPGTMGIVRKIVGRNFNPLILDSPQNIFLEVYSPWCIDCDATSKQVEKLAEHFKGAGNLIFGRIDASLNEHPALQVENFPTLLFYPSGNKSNPIKVSKQRTFGELVGFINKVVFSEEAKDLSTEPTMKDEL